MGLLFPVVCPGRFWGAGDVYPWARACYGLGMKNQITDVPGILVGQAEDQRLKTGVSVVTADQPFTAAVHVMGGAPGTRETDALDPERTVQQVHALVLSGGSAFGLAAADGVVQSLRAQGKGFPVGPARVPIVPAAILFDLLAGGEAWDSSPYADLGAAAYAARGRDVALGSVGAGTGCTTASLKGGVGTASMQLASGHTVGALVAVNALGSATVDGGRHFWAAPFEVGDEFGGLGVTAPRQPPMTKLDALHNTTIAIVATDADLTQAQCKRVATTAHDGMARALVPSHTPMDGDLVFAAATGAKPATDMDLMWLCHGAATVLARAIARGVHAASPYPGDVQPCWGSLS